MGPDQVFGEIGLLRSSPRTATRHRRLGRAAPGARPARVPGPRVVGRRCWARGCSTCIAAGTAPELRSGGGTVGQLTVPRSRGRSAERRPGSRLRGQRRSMAHHRTSRRSFYMARDTTNEGAAVDREDDVEGHGPGRRSPRASSQSTRTRRRAQAPAIAGDEDDVEGHGSQASRARGHPAIDAHPKAWQRRARSPATRMTSRAIPTDGAAVAASNARHNRSDSRRWVSGACRRFRATKRSRGQPPGAGGRPRDRVQISLNPPRRLAPHLTSPRGSPSPRTGSPRGASGG